MMIESRSEVLNSALNHTLPLRTEATHNHVLWC